MRIKRFFALLAGLALLLPVFALPAQAAAPCGCGEVIQVWADGFGQALYYHEGTPDEEKAELFTTDNLMDGLKELLRGIGRSILCRSWDPLARGIAELAMGMLGHLRLDLHGQSIAPIGSHWVIDDNQAANHAGRANFSFRYDYRMDPFELADQLDAYIEALCLKTGHDTIALFGHSEGANVVMTYVRVHGTGRLETLILGNAGWRGLSLAGQLFAKAFALDPAAITNYIAFYDDGSGLLRAGMDLLRTSRLLNFTPALGRGLTKTLLDPLFEHILVPLFCRMPAIWAFVPDAYFARALKVLGDDPDHAELKEKAIKYHEEVFIPAPDLLRQAQADGVRVAVIAAYGPPPLPLTKDVTYLSDSLIDTASMSGGATTAPIGQTLPPGNPTYRSPDNLIDAATCALPDQTWFIKYNGHDAHPGAALRRWITYNDAAHPTVFDDADFPQYLKRTEDGGTAPLLGTEPEFRPAKNFPQALWNFMKALLK